MKIHLQDLDKESIYTEDKDPNYGRHFPGRAFDKAKRWIRSQAGKHFDEVFSKWLKLPWIPERWRNKQGFGIYVELNVVDSNGGLVSTLGTWSLLDNRYDYVYKDQNGYLIYVKNPRQKKKPAQDLDHVILTDYTQYAKIDGIWFHVTIPQKFKSWNWLPRPRLTYKETPKRMKYKDFIDKFKLERHLIVKRSLSGKELRKAGLKNDNFSLAKFYACGM